MKKVIALVLILLLAFSFVSCSKGKKDPAEDAERLNSLFDNAAGQEQTTDNSNTDKQTAHPDVPVANSGAENNSKEPDKDTGKNENSEDTYSPDKEEGKDKDSETGDVTDADKNPEDETPDPDKEPPFDHGLYEKSVIVSRYNEAEDFYYDMLLQNFELDNMDTVKVKENGYETVFRRVILDDINSLDELKAMYKMYFTAAFVNKCDFSAYKESNGKLYCAATAGTSPGSYADGECTVKEYDVNKAVVAVSFGSGASAQYINAVRVGEIWYFDGVAIR